MFSFPRLVLFSKAHQHRIHIILQFLFIIKSPPKLLFATVQNSCHSMFSRYKIHQVFLDFSHQVSLSTDGLKEEQIFGICTLLTPAFSLCWAQLRDFSRILRDLPGLLQKVSCMLLRASFMITQSVSQLETQAKLLFNYLFGNVSPYENVSSLRVRTES